MKKEVSKKLTDPKEIELAEMLLKPLNSKEELRDWMYVYFDIWFPMGVVYPTSTHAPVDAMWRIYELMKTGKSAEIPEVVMLASRDSGKTLSAAALEVLCMIHFRFSLGHMSAISSQSEKSVQYVELFFRKIGKYLQHNGWQKNSDNKRLIEWITDDGQNVYLKIVIATMAGANSEHVPMLFCVDGKTKILVKNTNPEKEKRLTGRNRFRSMQTARGIYYALNRGEKVDIFSFNKEKGTLEFKPCTRATKTNKPIYRLSLDNGKYLDASLDHRVMIIGKGYVPLSNIEVGDKVAHFNKTHSNIKNREHDFAKKEFKKVPEKADVFKEVLLGSLLGDGGVYRKDQTKYKGNACFKENHCKTQTEYLRWKYEVFLKQGIHCRFGENAYSGYTGEKQYRLQTGQNSFFNQYVTFKKDFHKTGILEDIGPLALAVWYQDDGSKKGFDFSTHGFTKEQVEYLSDLINRKFGFNTKAQVEAKKDGRIFYKIRGGVEDKVSFHKICGHLFHPCMQFKLEDIKQSERICKCCKKTFYGFESTHCGLYCYDDFCQMVRTERITAPSVTKIEYLKDGEVFDFTVEDNHNFIANGILVHNCDEVDLISNANVLAEAQLIPSNYKQYQPLFTYLSTLKFAGGLMQKTLNRVHDSGGEILRWNIIDITERITHEEAQIDKPKVLRYITKQLPMSNISPTEWEKLHPKEQDRYEPFEAYAGIAEHKLLPVMKNYLVDRPQIDHGGLYKTPTAVLNLFKKVSDSMASAQLLCEKPSSEGLVYPKFSNEHNTISTEQAFERLLGKVPPNTSYEHLIETLQQLGIEFYGGADWGHTDETSFIVSALLPNGDWWILDMFAAPAMEIPEIIETAENFQKRYGIKKWYVDQNYPAYCVELRKKGLRVPEFNKDVNAGISAVQKKITNSTGKRSMFIIRRDETSRVLDAFNEYSWKRDGKGDIIEGKPDHKHDGTADIMDSIRYIAQNLFTAKTGGVKVAMAGEAKAAKPTSTNAQIMRSKIEELAENDTPEVKKMKKRITLWT